MTQLEVRPLATDSSGYGVVAIAEARLTQMGLADDDFVGLSAEGTCLNRAVRAAKCDDPNVVGLGKPTRDRLGVDEGDHVTVEPLSVTPAHRIRVDCHDIPDGVDEGDLRQRLCHRLVSANQTLSLPITPSGDGHWQRFDVDIEAVVPPGTVGSRPSTTIQLDGRRDESLGSDNDSRAATTESGYAQIGGLDDVVDKVREVIELPLAQPELFDELGSDPPSGVLLHGPPGTGKTLLARAVADEADADFHHLSASAVFSKWVGETEANIREIFEEARSTAPAIVYVDEIDAIAGKRDEGRSWEARAVTELLTQIDGLDSGDDVVVLASTNRPDVLDPALRRPGRFDREIKVDRPDEAGRRDILSVHTRDVPLASSVDLDEVAARTVGYTGADLEALVQEAVTAAARRLHGLGDTTTPAADDTMDIRGGPDNDIRVTASDIAAGLKTTDPNGLREHNVELPETEWDDIGGLATVKRRLKRAVVWPQRYEEVYDAASLDAGSGVLLHGPPGTGKTMLARAAANATRATVIPVDGPEVVGSHVGETEAAIRRVFQRAREHAPCVVVVDELDAVAPAREAAPSGSCAERAVTQLLTELDGLSTDDEVRVIGTTNRPDSIDEALRRPGRLGTAIRVGRPDETARREILSVHLDDRPLAADVDASALAARTEGFTGADLEDLCHAAAERAVERTLESDHTAEMDTAVATVEVRMADFEAALSEKSRSVGGCGTDPTPGPGRAFN